ncbi:hypothetical protein WG66_010179 [Moniliophthora roreri]|nr:hypothetical protein WG66_010179 [Moniliophthora roreri]
MRFTYRLNVAQLKDLCHRYKEKRSGNKADLLRRLLDLSENWENWSRVKAGARRTHKGEQPGSKKKSERRARRRRQEFSGSVGLAARSIAHGAKDTYRRDQ